MNENSPCFYMQENMYYSLETLLCYVPTVKPVNKGHPRETQNMAFIDRWSLFRGYIALFYQRGGTEVCPLFTGWSLFGGGL